MYSLIVKACIISALITMQYQKKVASSRNIENLIMHEKVHYSGNGCRFNAITQYLVSCIA